MTPCTVGGVLGVGPLVEFRDEVGESGAGSGGGEVLGEVHEGGEGFPSFSHGAGAGRGLWGPALAGEDGTYLGGQVDGIVEQGVVAAEAGGGAQGDTGSSHLGAVEEPLGSPQLVGHAGVGEGLLVGLGLGVGAEQDGDLAGGDARVEEFTDAAGGALRLGGFVAVLDEDRFGSGGALGDQFEAVVGGATAGLGEEAVGEADDLGVER
ncbi:hypothetical protein GCM10020256_24530 [Streptomyces thermocoprophilus]